LLDNRGNNTDISPFENALVVKRISGRVLYHALETSIGDMHMDGHFLQVSGLHVVATWKRKAGNRVIDIFLKAPGTELEKLDPARMYTVALVGFITRGYDGYTWFPEEETIVNEEAAMKDTSLMLRIFGHGEEVSDGDQSKNDRHVKGIEKARKATIVGRNVSDGLPSVNPRVDDRVRFIEYPAL
jgi:5''-nucleotidase/2'',3''-cyclic phosphodiesterase and related esterases